MLRKNNILIVKDNDDCRKLLALLINRLGYETIEAPSGVEAINRASSMHPALILMDLYMPEMTGAETTEILKANPSTRDIPVIICIDLIERVHISRALDAGAADILYKPITVPTLRELLGKYLSNGGIRGG
jgi:CheY-like chemotaxis protein